MDITITRTSFERPILWGVFFVYLIVSGYTMIHHEMWVDEIHSWNIAKGSPGYFDLIYNTRYEGHPPIWYTILWTISKFTHNVVYVQMVHWLIAALTVLLILFFSPMALVTRILIPFGYYFLYEYSVLSRNYAIGVLLACFICIITQKQFRYKTPLYYLLLFLMSNTHLLGLVLASCLHLYFLLLNIEQKKDTWITVQHILIGGLALFPSLYFIFPPADSQLNTQYWINRWGTDHIKTLGQVPLRSFIPFPAWWNDHFWNTQFLLETTKKSKLLNLGIAIISLVVTISILRRNKKSLVLFLSNLLLSFAIALVVFPLTSGRYAGFIFIGFIIAYWLYCYETPVTTKNKVLVSSLLVIQIITGVFMIWKDIHLPFANGNKVNELLNTPPKNTPIIADYWAMNVVSAFADRPIYCLDLQKEMSFVIWGPELGKRMKSSHRYSEGLKEFFQKERRQEVYIISTSSPEMLDRVDRQLFRSYQVRLIDKKEGAIERSGNLYLYLVKPML